MTLTFEQWLLVARAKPTGDALRLLGGTGCVKRDDALQDLGISQRPWPSISIGNRCIEVVVELAKRGDERGIVDDIVFRRKNFPGADFL
ncbi:MAG: hypothetical protein WC378_04995 [Opitutaceae bacterium]